MYTNIYKNHALVKQASNVSAICQSLFQKTPINYFSCFRAHNTHEYSGLLSDGKWGEHYLNNQYLSCDIDIYCKQDLSGEHQIVLSEISPLSPYLILADNKARTKKLLEDCVLFQYTHGMVFVEKTKTFTECFFFVGDDRDPNLREFLLKNRDELKKFILYFKDQMYSDSELAKAFKKKYDMPGDSIKTIESANNNMSLDLPIKRYYLGGDFNDVYFTSKEMLCLFELINGKSANEIAVKLNISKRTVQTHFNHIKEKTKCRYLSDIISLLMNSNYFRFILKNHSK